VAWSKHATASDVFTETYHWQWRSLFSTNTNRVDRYLRVYFIVIKNPFLSKHVTGSGAFTPRRHWQWRVSVKTPLTVARLYKNVIRRFKILFLSLLLLII
jgi:hypothetical protein